MNDNKLWLSSPNNYIDLMTRLVDGCKKTHPPPSWFRIAIYPIIGYEKIKDQNDAYNSCINKVSIPLKRSKTTILRNSKMN